ncbi:MAG: hypothetical protein Q8Q39_01520 [bacterium]|nr:hypothetical protein [bacterium]
MDRTTTPHRTVRCSGDKTVSVGRSPSRFTSGQGLSTIGPRWIAHVSSIQDNEKHKTRRKAGFVFLESRGLKLSHT